MMNRQMVVAMLVLGMPFALMVRRATAQDAGPAAPPAQTMGAPDVPAAANRDHADRPWGPRHDWERADRRERRDGEMDSGAMGLWGRGDSLLPMGLWWKDSQVAARLGLTAEQQKRILDLFIQSRVELIRLHATLQEEQLMLVPLLNATPFDETKAMAQIDKIADTRAELEKTNAKMLLNIRGVLTPEQWTKLRDRGHRMRGSRDRGDAGPQGPPRPN